MNKLEEWIHKNKWNEVQVMNELQDCALVSSNAVMAKDVSDADFDEAIAWLLDMKYKGTRAKPK